MKQQDPSLPGEAEERAQAGYFLPSLLGSEVGNALHTSADVAEKAHIENVVAGMVHYALQDGFSDGPQGVPDRRAGSHFQGKNTTTTSSQIFHLRWGLPEPFLIPKLTIQLLSLNLNVLRCLHWQANASLLVQ